MAASEDLVTHLPTDHGGGDAGLIVIADHPLLPWAKPCTALLDLLDVNKIGNFCLSRIPKGPPVVSETDDRSLSRRQRGAIPGHHRRMIDAGEDRHAIVAHRRRQPVHRLLRTGAARQGDQSVGCYGTRSLS